MTPPEGGPPAWRARLGGLPHVALIGDLVVFEARTWNARRRGLAGLPELPASVGLLIAPCRSIHTFGMAFPLDLIWLDRAGDVRGVTEAVPPRRLRSDLRGHSVIEVAAGRGRRFAQGWASR